jgi:16S rRNA (cytosine1402-N4)-methyltransferase
VAHIPVLLNEVLEQLDPHPGDFMIDGTVDGGGHAAAIIQKIMPGGMFLGVDWDERMIAEHEARRQGGARERYLHGNYAELPDLLKQEKLGKADGLLLDLGFSSEQLAHSGRGFSFEEASADEPLLMTYDDSCVPISEIIRGLREEELARIIFELGGERGSRKIAQAIKLRGRKQPIATSGELAEVVRGALPKNYERGRIDPATRTFQALRIYANDELGNLTRMLEHLPEILKESGRVAIISFHSLEDRIVKQSFQKLQKEGVVEILTKKPIAASRGEALQNPRSRSAKLRAAKMHS